MKGRLFSVMSRIAARLGTAREEREHQRAVAWRKGVRARRLRRQAQAGVAPEARQPIPSELVKSSEATIICDIADRYRHRGIEKEMAVVVLSEFYVTGELPLPPRPNETRVHKNGKRTVRPRELP